MNPDYWPENGMDSVKKRKSSRKGKVRVWIKLLLSSGQVLWRSQTGGSLFLKGSSIAQVPCVYLTTPLAQMPLSQCHSKSWPAKLLQWKVPNWRLSSSEDHSCQWSSGRCPEDNSQVFWNFESLICRAASIHAYLTGSYSSYLVVHKGLWWCTLI